MDFLYYSLTLAISSTLHIRIKIYGNWCKPDAVLSRINENVMMKVLMKVRSHWLW